VLGPVSSFKTKQPPHLVADVGTPDGEQYLLGPLPVQGLAGAAIGFGDPFRGLQPQAE